MNTKTKLPKVQYLFDHQDFSPKDWFTIDWGPWPHKCFDDQNNKVVIFYYIIIGPFQLRWFPTFKRS